MGNVQVGEMTDAGVHRIGDALVFNQIVDHSAGPLHRVPRFGLQQHGTAFVNYLPYLFQRQIVAVNVKCLHGFSSVPQSARMV